MKTLDLSFDSILPEEITNYCGDIIFTTRMEYSQKSKKVIFYEDISKQYPPSVIRGILIQKLDLHFQEDDLIIGVDPGQRIGLSILYYGTEIENSFYSSVDGLVSHIIRVLGVLRARRKILKIGNGHMEIATQIVKTLNLKFCSSFELEFVDEYKTTMKIKNFNQRGRRDMLSAKFISSRQGSRRSILPLSIIG